MASPYKRMVAIAGFPEPLGLQVLNELWRQVPTPRFNLPIIVLTTDPRAAARRGGRDFGWVWHLLVL